eukprot:m51a1_g3755 putative translation initiation factor eif3 subunit (251) ;mRNA; f:79032-79914
MGDWEAVDITGAPISVPPPTAAVAGNNSAPDSWEDDDGVKDSWEDEEVPKPKKPESPAPVEAPKSKKASKVKAAVIKQRGRELDEAGAAAVEVPLDDPLLEKQRKQRAEEESDLRNAHEMFGGLSTAGELDKFIPKSQKDFRDYAALMAQRAEPYEKELHYTEFVCELVRLVTVNMRSEDVQAVSRALTTAVNERLREEKAKDGKKKPAKAAKTAPKRGAGQDEGDDLFEGDFTEGNAAYAHIEDKYDFM